MRKVGVFLAFPKDGKTLEGTVISNRDGGIRGVEEKEPERRPSFFVELLSHLVSDDPAERIAAEKEALGEVFFQNRNIMAGKILSLIHI